MRDKCTAFGRLYRRELSIETTPLPEKKTGPQKVGHVSYKCSHGDHSQCSTKSCTCGCGHKL